MSNVHYTIGSLISINIPWWTGLVLIGVPVVYVIGMTVASVFLFRWFRRGLQEQENQQLEKIFQISYTLWILFFILLPVITAIWFFIAPSIAYLFIIPGILFVLFITFLLIFNSKFKKANEIEVDES